MQTTAIDLANRYAVNGEKAGIAGLLHDCARGFSFSKMEAIWRSNPGYLDSEEEQIPALWHAPVSAVVAKTDFQIADPEILTAIRFHPTGRPGMTSLEKIIIIADFIEPNRAFTGVEQYRVKALDGLNQITLLILEAKLKYLKNQGLQIHSRGIAASEFLKKEIIKTKS